MCADDDAGASASWGFVRQNTCDVSRERSWHASPRARAHTHNPLMVGPVNAKGQTRRLQAKENVWIAPWWTDPYQETPLSMHESIDGVVLVDGNGGGWFLYSRWRARFIH